MYFLIIIFAGSLLALSLLILYRARQIRAGVILPEDNEKQYEHFLEIVDLPTVQNISNTYMRTWLRKMTLFILRISIKIVYFVKKKLDVIVARVHKVIVTHERTLEDSTTDTGEKFLNSIGEYKDRMKRKRPHRGDTM